MAIPTQSIAKRVRLNIGFSFLFGGYYAAKKRDYEINEINEINENFVYFVFFVYFVILFLRFRTSVSSRTETETDWRHFEACQIPEPDSGADSGLLLRRRY